MALTPAERSKRSREKRKRELEQLRNAPQNSDATVTQCDAIDIEAITQLTAAINRLAAAIEVSNVASQLRHGDVTKNKAVAKRNDTSNVTKSNPDNDKPVTVPKRDATDKKGCWCVTRDMKDRAIELGKAGMTPSEVLDELLGDFEWDAKLKDACIKKVSQWVRRAKQ